MAETAIVPVPPAPVIERVEGLEFGDQQYVGIATTCYKSLGDLRCKIALRTIASFVQQGVRLVFSDGGSAPEVIEAFKHAGAIVYQVSPDRGGLTSQLLDGVTFILTHVSKNKRAPYILKLEPEKADLLPSGYGKIENAIAAGLDIVHIGRTDRALETLPWIQALYESLGGKFMESLGLPPDALSGGRLYSPRGVQYLLAMEYLLREFGKEFNNWLYLYVVALEAKERRLFARVLPMGALATLDALGELTVSAIFLDMIHPDEMTLEEDNDPQAMAKRLDQLVMQVLWMAYLYLNGSKPDMSPLRKYNTTIVKSLQNFGRMSEFAELMRDFTTRMLTARVFGPENG